MALQGAGARVVPTRRGGKRCLDYMITNVPAEPGIEQIQHSTQAYSDHKLMICSCQIRGEPRTRWRLQATAQYAIPENCSKDKNGIMRLLELGVRRRAITSQCARLMS